MPATLYEFIDSILTPDQKAAVCSFTLTGAAMPAASMATPARMARTKRTRTRSTGSGKTNALLDYFGQHPTAALTIKQLRETSPFRTMPENILSRMLNAATKSGKLTEENGAWRLGKVVPSTTLATHRSRRTKASAPAGKMAATG